MIKIFLAILSIKLAALATYLTTEILSKYVYSYSKNFGYMGKIFLFVYSGLIFILLPLITSINLALIGESNLAYYNILYNVLLDATISSGILILISKKDERIILDKKIIFITSLIFTINIFLIIKGFLNMLDSFILFFLFIFSSLYLLKSNIEKSNYKSFKNNKNIVDLLFKIFFILISFIIFIICSQILSYNAIYLKNILNNAPLVAYIINLISNTAPNFLFGYMIYKESKNFEEAHLSIFGQFFYSFTICIGIICGILPILFTNKDVIVLLSSFIALYSSMIIFNLYAYGHSLPKEVGIFLIMLGLLVGLITIY
ncbi:MAG: hypothetical protein QXW13_01245 [Nanopusillaceae archaeon]